VSVVKRSGEGTRESGPKEEKEKEEQEQNGGRGSLYRKIATEVRNRFLPSWPRQRHAAVTMTTAEQQCPSLGHLAVRLPRHT
jgi:hypothetical protein